MQGPIHGMSFGDELPDVRTAIPGPRSRALAERLARVESRNITRIDEDGPIFWSESAGANVRDADDNVFIDLTAGFGVAGAGHANPAVAAAAAAQLRRLPHAMGDVHPAAVKVELLERLAALAPADLGVAILSANGSDAVESALKTAALRTGRPGVVAFEGSYHGLGYGALAVTHLRRFREPFLRQLYPGVRFAPYPHALPAPDAAPGGEAPGGPAPAGDAPAPRASLEAVRSAVRAAEQTDHPVGAVIVEPVQGRGGIHVPPGDFLPGLRTLCDELDVLLIVDEVYTGFGRTGRWFACEHVDVVPDLLVVGKALAGGLPLSAVLGRPEVMEAWPESEGEAIHTSTFLGNPVACAAALAHLEQIEERGLLVRATRLGDLIQSRVEAWRTDRPGVGPARGLGLMRAVPLHGLSAAAVAADALRAGVIVLPEGDALAITPPLVISEAQLEHALQVVREAIERRRAVGPA